MKNLFILISTIAILASCKKDLSDEAGNRCHVVTGKRFIFSHKPELILDSGITIMVSIQAFLKYNVGDEYCE